MADDVTKDIFKANAILESLDVEIKRFITYVDPNETIYGVFD